MKAKLLFPLLILVSIFMTSCSSDSMIEDETTQITLEVAPEAKIIEIEILELINDYRIGLNLTPLNNLNIIKSVAYTHTEYMLESNDVSHANFYQRSLALTENASAIKVGENVAYGFSNAQSVVNAWINSDGHRANIEGDFNYFDVSAEQNAQGKWYFTNMFIKK